VIIIPWKDRICGIYKITNIINNKIYIGGSINIKHRFSEHKWQLNNNIHGNIHLQRAWNKYGKDNFKFEIIEECDILLLKETEQQYIESYNSYKRDFGYNIEKLVVRKELSQETKLKISIAHKGKKLSISQRNNMSKSAKGRIFSEKHKQRIGDAHRGEKNSNYGMPLSDDVKLKLSLKLRGENNPRAKLKEEDIIDIRNMLKEGKSLRNIAKLYNVSKTTIRDINIGKLWKHV
jgi:group I intron endonuclease